MASFSEKRSYNNAINKASAKFGKNKEISITPFNGNTYIHISDMKMCFNSPGGIFDYSRSKSISFNMEEIEQLKKLLQRVDFYHNIFNETQIQSTQKKQELHPQQHHIQERPHQQAPQQIHPQPPQQIQQGLQHPQPPQQEQQQQQGLQQQEAAAASPPYVTLYNKDWQDDGEENIFYAIPVTLPQ